MMMMMMIVNVIKIHFIMVNQAAAAQ
jgi:hypothetical protein